MFWQVRITHCDITVLTAILFEKVHGHISCTPQKPKTPHKEKIQVTEPDITHGA
jgi:hypothetical protein